MVKPQSCFQSFAPRSASSSGDALVPGRVIPSGDRRLSLKTRLAGLLLGSSVSPWAVALAIATAAAISTAPQTLAADVSDWSYSPETGAIGFASQAKPKYFLMANPMRIVVDLPGAAVNSQALEAQAGGVFTQIRAARTKAGQTRLVLQLAPGTVLQPGQVELTALGGGRWSLQPLLADGFQPEAETTAAAPVAVVPSSATVAEEPEFMLPSLQAMEAASEEEFVSMEETLERQRAAGVVPAPVAVPQGNIPVGDSDVSDVAWGSSQLPPVPTNISPPSATLAPAEVAVVPQVPAEPEDDLPQLPQPRLGQGPLAFNPPANASLVDPAQVVDTQQLTQPRQTFAVRPPAAVEPVIDPKALSLDEQQQSAAALGGQTGLLLQRGRGGIPIVRGGAKPAAAARAKAVPETVAVPQPAEAEVPFVVEFGAPPPSMGL